MSNYMLEIDIFSSSSQKNLGVLRGAFKGFGCPKRHPDALLAKTMSNITLENISLEPKENQEKSYSNLFIKMIHYK